MKYFRVKPEYDNKKRISTKGRIEGIYVANELYTEAELKKYIVQNIFEAVTIPKTKTYWFFGARFEVKEA